MNIEGFTLGAVLLMLLKEVFNSFSDKRRDNTKALEENTHAVIKLKAELEFVHKALSEIPELRRDIDGAHRKLRGLEAKMGESL